MAVRTREEILTKLTSAFGDNTSDDVIGIIEDVTDTLTDFETKVSGDGKDWKAEAEKIDKEWREKYIARFNGSGEDPDDNNGANGSGNKVKTFEDLFKEGE